MKDYIDFEEKFRKLIEFHKDSKDYSLIKDYPDIFSTIVGIVSDKSADGVTKMIMNSAICYFVLPTDVASEKELGIRGYLDDFYVCICALRELMEYDKKLGEYLISKHWKLKEEYEDYIPKKYYVLTKIIEPKKISEILSYSGIGYIADIIKLKTNPSKYSEQKIRDLQRKIHYLFYLIFNRPFEGIKNAKKEFEDTFFGTEEFLEFDKKLELLSKSDKEFVTAKSNVDKMLGIEEKLKKIKARRLLR